MRATITLLSYMLFSVICIVLFVGWFSPLRVVRWGAPLCLLCLCVGDLWSDPGTSRGAENLIFKVIFSLLYIATWPPFL